MRKHADSRWSEKTACSRMAAQSESSELERVRSKPCVEKSLDAANTSVRATCGARFSVPRWHSCQRLLVSNIGRLPLKHFLNWPAGQLRRVGLHADQVEHGGNETQAVVGLFHLPIARNAGVSAAGEQQNGVCGR